MTEEIGKSKILMTVLGVVLIGSVWGLMECLLGGLKPAVAGLPISMGAVLAGLFGLFFMILARRMFGFAGVSLAVAVVAGILRLFAPVGTYVLCSSIAIMAEGLVFEIIVNRRVFQDNLDGNGDIRSLASLGIISAFAVFCTGYITSQILTPIVARDTGNIADVISILPLIFGRGFFAAVLGGISAPIAALITLPVLDGTSVRKGVFFTSSIIVTVFCWSVIYFVFY
ncbi:MAG: hypothetical protein ACMUIG_02240 [Thermoplasmatota archaeon]